MSKENEMIVSFKFKDNVSEEQEQVLWDSLFEILLTEVETAEKKKKN